LEKEVGQAVAENVEDLDPTTNFTYQNRSLKTVANDLVKRQAVLQAAGKGNLLPDVDTAVMDLSAAEFIGQRPDLKRDFDALMKRALREKELGRPALYEEITTFLSQGKMGTRRPDTIEVRLDGRLISITDVTRKQNRPEATVHEFKTRFYGEAMRAILGKKGPRVEAYEHNPALAIHRPAKPVGRTRKTEPEGDTEAATPPKARGTEASEARANKPRLRVKIPKPRRVAIPETKKPEAEIEKQRTDEEAERERLAEEEHEADQAKEVRQKRQATERETYAREKAVRQAKAREMAKRQMMEEELAERAKAMEMAEREAKARDIAMREQTERAARVQEMEARQAAAREAAQRDVAARQRAAWERMMGRESKEGSGSTSEELGEREGSEERSGSTSEELGGSASRSGSQTPEGGSGPTRGGPLGMPGPARGVRITQNVEIFGGGALAALNVFQVARDIYESETDQGEGTFKLMSLPGHPWIINRRQYFKNGMKALGYDVEALEGQTLVLGGGCMIIKIENGLPIVLKDNCPDPQEEDCGSTYHCYKTT
jgi:hypothetical protein